MVTARLLQVVWKEQGLMQMLCPWVRDNIADRVHEEAPSNKDTCPQL